MNTSPHHTIDNFEFVDGSIEVHGWVIGSGKIIRAEICRDDGKKLAVNPKHYGIKSPDVERVFGKEGEYCRFCISIPLEFIERPQDLLNLILKIIYKAVEYDIKLNPKKSSWYLFKKIDNGSLKVGIGICTYNRQDELLKTINSVKSYTNIDYSLFISDDGSSDNTKSSLEKIPDISFSSEKNKGISWNKNRALYYLSIIEKCDVVILLEDDTRPMSLGWQDPWVRAALIYGHINLCPPWFPPPVSGSGTWDNPYLTKDLTAQCSSFSREALNYAGYFDSRFKGYGHEHIEHTSRLIRLGYGGMKDCFLSLKSDFDFAPSQSHISIQTMEHNRNLVGPLLQEISYRSPWSSEEELLEFREEMNKVIKT